ncbi:MAG: hypothetical protein DME75_00835 [Verrucomicrobia bacterium]|nr:MAG: hypothetical protein DME75_00835 [Verrucomicrobiota bacterium]
MGTTAAILQAIEPGLQVSLYAPNLLSRLKTTPGTLQEGGASFATTHWSEVARCALTDVPSATDALAQLCETYWPPIYSFIRRRGYPPPDAQDLTQSFFAFFLRTKAYGVGTYRVDILINNQVVGSATFQLR